MFPQFTDLEKSVGFYVITFFLVLVACVASGQMGFDPGLWLMFIPLIAVMIMFFVVTRDAYSKDGWLSLGLHRAGFRSWGLALLAPIVVIGCAYGFGALLGIVSFTSPGPKFITNFPPSVLMVGIGLSILASFGEEIGWRGYLLPRLLSLGRTRALLVSGLLHGLFHLPLILLTPFYHGLGNRFIVVPLFILALTAAGVWYGYLRLTSQSVWPAAISHTSFNLGLEQIGLLTIAASPLAVEYLLGESGLITLVCVVLLAGVLIRRLNRQQPQVLASPGRGSSHVS